MEKHSSVAEWAHELRAGFEKQRPEPRLTWEQVLASNSESFSTAMRRPCAVERELEDRIGLGTCARVIADTARLEASQDKQLERELEQRLGLRPASDIGDESSEQDWIASSKRGFEESWRLRPASEWVSSCQRIATRNNDDGANRLLPQHHVPNHDDTWMVLARSSESFSKSVQNPCTAERELEQRLGLCTATEKELEDRLGLGTFAKVVKSREPLETTQDEQLVRELEERLGLSPASDW